MNLKKWKIIVSLVPLNIWLISSPLGDGEKTLGHLGDTSMIRDTNDEKVAYVVWIRYLPCRVRMYATNKKELMHGCLIIRSSLLYWPLTGLYFIRPRYVTIFNFSSTSPDAQGLYLIDENPPDVVLGYFVFGARVHYSESETI